MNLFKHILGLVFFYFFCLTSSGQGKVIDLDTNSPLSNVYVIFISTQDTLYTNTKGHFKIDALGTYEFNKPGYISKRVIINTTKPIIQLGINPSELNEIVINASHITKQLKSSYATTQVLSSQDIHRGNTIDLAPVLNRVPGVFMQNGALNTNKIIIRGIGSRNLYGTSKIRAYFQDIPLTTGNGETTVEDFELGTISRIEIIKGSGSSIHGAGLGGTINLIPMTGLFNQTHIENTTTIGSFGLFKDVFNFSTGSNKTNINTSYSHTQSDGYRDNSTYNRQTFTVNANHYFNERNEINFLGSFVNLKAYIPSSINEDTFLNSPTSAAYTWQQSKGYEGTKRSIFGLSWHHQYNTTLSQKTSIFTSIKNAYEPRPFNILDENLMAFGIRSRLLGQTPKLKWTIGGEFFNDFYKWKTFENLYQEYPSGTGSVQGNLLSHFKENRYYYNLFFESHYNITDKTEIAFGLNLNKTAYDLNDNFNNDTNPDQSGAYSFKNILSPTFGVTQTISEHINIYSNVSHGFSPPTTSETLLPDGLINPNIKPETGWNFEIGTRSTFFNNRLHGNVSIYRLNIKNLLVAERTGNDEYIGVNAGKTQHDGLEASMTYQWLRSKNLQINSFVNYTFNNFKFKEYIDGDNNYSGNDLTGVPKDILNLGLVLESHNGLYGNIDFLHVGTMPITDSNSLYSNSYSLTNFKSGWKKNLNKKLNMNIFIGINNIFDKAYASQILINASGFNGSQPRYYYPGYPINYYSGFNITYNIN